MGHNIEALRRAVLGRPTHLGTKSTEISSDNVEKVERALRKKYDRIWTKEDDLIGSRVIAQKDMENRVGRKTVLYKPNGGGERAAIISTKFLLPTEGGFLKRLSKVRIKITDR